MFRNRSTSSLIILALLAGQSGWKRCLAWTYPTATCRHKASYLKVNSKPHFLQRREALIQGIHVLIGTSLILPRPSNAYYDYTDEEIELQQERSVETIITPPPQAAEPRKKTTTKRRRFPFGRDDPVPPVGVGEDSPAMAPEITEPAAVITPPVETEPTDPATVPVPPVTSDVKCLTDCMYTCQQEASANDKLVCLDNCPTRCLSESATPRLQEEPVIPIIPSRENDMQNPDP